MFVDLSKQELFMYGIEMCYANAVIRALLSARSTLMHMPTVRALNTAKGGKKDTLGLDSGTEGAIEGVIREFDPDADIITEETVGRRCAGAKTILICDPVDRSKFLRRYIEGFGTWGNDKKVGDLIYHPSREEVWSDVFAGKPELPLTIVSPTSALTCIRDGKPVFTAIVNYLSDRIYIAGPMGVYSVKIPDYREAEAVSKVDLDYIMDRGERIFFPSAARACPSHDDQLRFATFLGKAGYQENFDATAMFHGQVSKEFLHHAEPGGPSRVLYLSDLELGHGPIGFVMSNGEKIGEFVHWLAFAMFGTRRDGQKALRVYEVTSDRPCAKDGVYMSTLPAYSMFQEREGGAHFLDMQKVQALPHPNHFRATIIVTAADNGTVREIMRMNGFREIKL